MQITEEETKINKDSTEIEKPRNLRKARTKRINLLLKKHKRLIGSYKSLIKPNGPVVFLMRRSGTVEMHEGAKRTLWEYKHSDESTRFLILAGKPFDFPYGRDSFKAYFCHEDVPLPLPQDPEVTAEQMNITIEKTLNDVRKWKAEEWKAKGDMWWKILMGIAALVALWVVYKITLGNSGPAPVQQTATVVQNLSQVATIIR